MANIIGTANNDVLNGTAGDDLIEGLAESDTLYGLAGNDTLDGGTGADKMYGGAGNDAYVSTTRATLRWRRRLSGSPLRQTVRRVTSIVIILRSPPTGTLSLS